MARPRGMPDAAAPRARRIRDRRDRDDDPAAPAPRRQPRFPSRRTTTSTGSNGFSAAAALTPTRCADGPPDPGDPAARPIAPASSRWPNRRTTPSCSGSIPKQRGILPLDGFHVPRRLRRVVRQGRFELRCRQRFRRDAGRLRRGDREAPQHLDQRRNRAALHRAPCAGRRAQRRMLARRQLVGGLYGVSIGGAFFGESMFSRVTDASKVALVHLVALLRAGGYRLLDLQFLTPHLAQFGAIEVPRAHTGACSPRRCAIGPSSARAAAGFGGAAGGGAARCRRRLAIEQVDVVDRVLQRRQRRARREHPAAEQALRSPRPARFS